MAERRGPIFVGGTGRCGTAVLASLLGRHSELCDVVEEVRIHAEPDGLPGLLEGTIALDDFVGRLRSHWWRFRQPWGEVRGLHLLVSEEQFERAVRAFEVGYEADSVMAARQLLSSLVAPVAARAVKSRWVESTPHVVQYATTLAQLFPEMKMVHLCRDGRDVASSVVSMPWGPDDHREALSWWGEHMRRGQASTRALPSGQLLELWLEDLVLNDRDTSYRRLLEFAQVEDEDQMREYFDAEVVAAHARIGRWRDEVDPQEEARLSAAYAEQLVSLGSDPAPANERYTF